MAGARGRRRLAGGLLALAAAVAQLATACDGEGEQVEAPDSVEAVADAYVAVLDEMLPVDDAAESPTVVYVWQLAEQPMSLDDQVVVIDSLAERYDVRFVDEAGAAVDPAVTLVPARDDGLLVFLGPVTVDAPHTVRIEMYANEDVVEAFVVTLVRLDDTWSVVAEERVDPEVLGAVI